jgi:hypothetical protein
MLRAYALETGSMWDETINAVLFSFRTAIHSGTNTSPDQLLFGQKLRTPLDAEIDAYIHEHRISPTNPYFTFHHIEALSRSRDLARVFMERAKRLYEEEYNSKHKRIHFNVVDEVCMQEKKHSNKLTPAWKGPYKVHARVSENMYLLHDTQGKPHPHPIDVKMLKRVVINTRDMDVSAPSDLMDTFSSSQSVAVPASSYAVPVSVVPPAMLRDIPSSYSVSQYGSCSSTGRAGI